MTEVEKLKYILIEKFINKVGLAENWAYNAAQQVVELINEGYEVKDAIQEVYRRL